VPSIPICSKVTREHCNFTITGLKAVFPVALATACPIGRIRNYMQRSLDHVFALKEIGRNGDFSRIPALRKTYKSHRRSELIRLGLASDVQVRQRGAWGSIQHSRLKTPEVDTLAPQAGGDVSFTLLLLFLKYSYISLFFAPGGPSDEEALFDDDDVTVLPAAARAACAAAFAEVFEEAEAEEIRDLEISLRNAPERPPAATPRRVAGFYEAMRMSKPMTTTPGPFFDE
jgi:hypothetical protein